MLCVVCSVHVNVCILNLTNSDWQNQNSKRNTNINKQKKKVNIQYALSAIARNSCLGNIDAKVTKSKNPIYPIGKDGTSFSCPFGLQITKHCPDDRYDFIHFMRLFVVIVRLFVCLFAWPSAKQMEWMLCFWVFLLVDLDAIFTCKAANLFY